MRLRAAALWAPVRLLWSATRGTRLRPWRSAYLRWRVETYSGVPAEQVDVRVMLRLLWRERRQVLRYLGWVGSMRQMAAPGRGR